MRIYKAVNLRDGTHPIRYFATMTQRRDYIRAERDRGVTGISMFNIEVEPTKVAMVKLLNQEIGDVRI